MRRAAAIVLLGMQTISGASAESYSKPFWEQRDERLCLVRRLAICDFDTCDVGPTEVVFWVNFKAGVVENQSANIKEPIAGKYWRGPPGDSALERAALHAHDLGQFLTLDKKGGFSLWTIYYGGEDQQAKSSYYIAAIQSHTARQSLTLIGRRS
jgi:hypothetical protein